MGLADNLKKQMDELEQPMPSYKGFGSATFPSFAKKEQQIDFGDLDQSPAVLYILDNSGKITHMTNRFILTGVGKGRQEKAQIVETFGLPSILFFGERVKTYSFSGLLLETTSSSQNYSGKYLWASSLVDLYDKYLRGSKLVENKSVAALSVKNSIVYGFVTALSTSENADNPRTASFNMSFIVTKEKMVGEQATIAQLYNIHQSITDGNTRTMLDSYSETISKMSEETDSVTATTKKDLLSNTSDVTTKRAINALAGNFMQSMKDHASSWASTYIAQVNPMSQIDIDAAISTIQAGLNWGEDIIIPYPTNLYEAVKGKLTTVFGTQAKDYKTHIIFLSVYLEAYNILLMAGSSPSTNELWT